MKRVLLRDRPPFKARDVIIGMMEAPSAGGQGITYAEMRKRDRVLDAIETTDASAKFIDLEDADHKVLLEVLNTAAFAVNRRELRKILEDIVEAKSPEDTLDLKVVGE